MKILGQKVRTHLAIFNFNRWIKAKGIYESGHGLELSQYSIKIQSGTGKVEGSDDLMINILGAKVSLKTSLMLQIFKI